MDEARTHHFLLHALNKASKDLCINPLRDILFQNNSKPAIEDLLELGTKADAIFSDVPNLSRSLCDLRTLLQDLQKLQGFNIRSLFFRPITNYNVFRVARAIEAEIISYLDREIVIDLVIKLRNSTDENQQVKTMIEFRNRVSRGFDRDFQELVLRGRVFSVLESVLLTEREPLMGSNRVRDEAALVVYALVEFNKDVFVGLALMGPTIRALISIASWCSIRVLCCLIRFIKTPLVDEIEANGEIPRIIDLLSSEDYQVRVAALNSILEIAFLGRKEVVEAMVGDDLVKRLVNLQRTVEVTHKSDLVETGRLSESEIGDRYNKVKWPCENCVARLVMQTQLGEGLEKTEKKEFKSKILKMVREASVSDAELAAIVAEVACGSSH